MVARRVLDEKEIRYGVAERGPRAERAAELSNRRHSGHDTAKGSIRFAPEAQIASELLARTDDIRSQHSAHEQRRDGSDSGDPRPCREISPVRKYGDEHRQPPPERRRIARPPQRLHFAIFIEWSAQAAANYLKSFCLIAHPRV